MKDYIVIAQRWDGEKFYVSERDLDFIDGLSDACIWSGEMYDMEDIKRIVENNARVHSYTFTIEEF